MPALILRITFSFELPCDTQIGGVMYKDDCILGAGVSSLPCRKDSLGFVGLFFLKKKLLSIAAVPYN